MGLAIKINVVLALNVSWFGAGFVQFAFKSRRASYGLVRSDDATARGREGVAGSLRFLGGLNLALAGLATMTLLRLDTFPRTLLVVPFTTFVIAHASQFLVNLPLAIAEARGLPLSWPVLRGPMLLIFVGDGVLMVLSAAIATLVA